MNHMCKNIYKYLKQNKERNPHQFAFIDEDESLTFEQLYNYSLSYSDAISTKCNVGDIILIITSRSCHIPALFYGIAMAGCTYVPVDETLPIDRILKIVHLVTPSLIINCSKRKISGLSYDITLNELLDDCFVGDFIPNDDLSLPLYVMFTSGSTGVPKGVTVSQMNVLQYVETMVDLFKIDGTDVLTTLASFDFDATIRDIYGALVCGCSVVLLPSQIINQPTKVVEAIYKFKVTVLFSWSAAAIQIIAQTSAINNLRGSVLRKIFFSGSVLRPQYLKQWQSVLPNVMFCNLYGPTECTGTTTYYIVDRIVNDWDDDFPLGRAIPGRKVLIIDPNDPTRILQKGELGEICIGGIGVSLGYYNDEKESQLKFIQNPCCHEYFDRIYRTGDIGRINPQTSLLEFHGRVDRQVKIWGHRVELDEIEKMANLVNGVEDCAALYEPNKNCVTLLYCGGDHVIENLAIFLREKLPRYMVPRRFIRVDKLQYTYRQKKDYKFLEHYL